jgi:dienelactone hydrolase
MRFIAIVAVLSLPLISPRAVAQQSAKDLEFPREITRLAALSTPRMALLKPDGAGPFPALVLHHQCGGLHRGKWQNQSMLSWTRRAVESGYVALLVDSLSQRGVDTVCLGAKDGLTFLRGVRDAFQAAEHLGKFEFIDKERIAHMGFSWGATVGLLANSASRRKRLGGGGSFAAFIGFYPGCWTIRPAQSSTYEPINVDMERHHLVLMGEKDNETPAGECVEKLNKAKSGGALVEWHVYSGATHCWDCENLNGMSKVGLHGTRITYRYSASQTSDSLRRAIDFLARANQPKF